MRNIMIEQLVMYDIKAEIIENFKEDHDRNFKVQYLLNYINDYCVRELNHISCLFTGGYDRQIYKEAISNMMREVYNQILTTHSQIESGYLK